MTMTSSERDSTDTGRVPADFGPESVGQKTGEAVQPVERPLEGQQLINPVQSVLPKVTSYPY